MLKLELIGHLGADAQIVETDGRKFASCRVAHSESWKGQDGVKHEQTTWVDVNLQADSPVLPYLVKGTLIYVRGSFSTRVYSSQKDRCMKAGISLRAESIQLLSAAKEREQQPTEEEKDAPFIG